MRQVYLHKKLNQPLTQGSIICGCIAADYPANAVDGIVITPRCDLDHNIKVSTVHYLPIVKFEDWLQVDGFKWMKNQMLKDCKDRLNKWISNATNIPDFLNSSLATKSKVSQILERDRLNGSIKESIDLYFDESDFQIKEYLKKNEKYYLKLLKSLTGNAIAPYYLIESWNKTCGYRVVILREIHQITRETALKLESGFFAYGQDEEFFIKNSLCRSVPEEPYRVTYEILTTVASPILEHLLQRYVNNFAKIGVEDFDMEDIHSNLSHNSILNNALNS